MRSPYFLCSCILLLASLALLSCANRQEHQRVSEAIASGNFKVAVKSLSEASEENEDSVDRSLLLLNLGMVYRLDGDYQASIRSWQQAKKAIAELRPTSVTETTASFLLNDNSQSFIGSYQEQQWLHIFQALNYLDINQPDGARVEMLQANQLHKEYAQEALEPPFMRYLAGMVFEFLSENDQALVAYRKALEVYPKSQTATPRSLYIDAARMMQRLGIKDELKKLIQEHNLSETELMENPNVTLIWVQGLVSEKQEKRITHWAPKHNRSFSIALPFYPKSRSSRQVSSLKTSAGNQVAFETVANLDASLRKEFVATEGWLLAKTIGRQVLKTQLGDALIQEGDPKSRLAGQLIGSLFNVLTESADLRSWNSLPHRVLLYRAQEKPGTEIDLGESSTANTLKVNDDKSTIFRSFFRLP